MKFKSTTEGRNRRRLSKGIAGIALAALLVPAQAHSEEWSGSVTLYGWLPWLDLEVETPSGNSTQTTIDADDVLDALKMVFMASGEVHYGRFGFLHDTVYSKLESGGTLGGPFSSDVDVEVKMLMFTNVLSYQVYKEDGRLIEPFAGVRYVELDTDVDIEGGGPLGLEASAKSDLDWWDPVIGVRGRVPVTDKLSLGGFADIGGFGVGSEFTWEIYAGLDYALSERFSAVAGFRYLSIDYREHGAELDLDMYGPLLGMTVKF